MKILNIKITGAKGYLGKNISSKLKENGHNVSGIDRELLYGPSEVLKAEIKNTDVIINLAGAPILQRWDKKAIQIIYDSRIKTTQNLVQAINELQVDEQPKKFISASAIGIYKSGFSHDEYSTNFDTGFVGKVVADWENASNELTGNVQRNIFRIGLVLGREAKTITNLLLPFKLGLAATLGDGKQPFPFVHLTDLIRAFVWAVEDNQTSGISNIVAPAPITNKEFTKSFAKELSRPAIFSIPFFVLKILLGKASVLLTESPQVEPKYLLEAGFEFKFPDIDSAMREIVKTKKPVA